MWTNTIFQLLQNRNLFQTVIQEIEIWPITENINKLSLRVVTFREVEVFQKYSRNVTKNLCEDLWPNVIFTLHYHSYFVNLIIDHRENK